MWNVASFRDPGGVCLDFGQRFLRLVTQDALSHLENFLASGVAADYFQRQQLIPTRKVGESEWNSVEPVIRERLARQSFAAVFEHERIGFPSYPYEWPAEMLTAAGELTLQLASECLTENFCLKDASPYNILFRGPVPVFVDLLSFERRDLCDALWKPYAQFMRSFILPLLVNQRWGIRLADIFLSRRDGLEPEEVYRMCGKLKRLLPPYLTSVSLPVWLSSGNNKKSLYQPKAIRDPERARFILQSLFHRLRKTLGAVGLPRQADSAWSGYMEANSYSKENFLAKEDFVLRFLKEFKPRKVLDVGSNTGHFSFLAAEAGASVVAVDSDSACVGRIWREAARKKLNILPLVVDLARPSPAVGWANREARSFLERAAGSFDAVLMLAVLHHLTVSERVPLPETMKLLASLTTDWLLIEFIGPGDDMFRRIARGREGLFAGLDTARFEEASGGYFETVRSQRLTGTERCLYLLRKKQT